jgi:predicted O-methyltransferase YrrM
MSENIPFSFLRNKTRSIRHRAMQRVNRILKGERANTPRISVTLKHNQDTIDFIKSTNCRHIAEIGVYTGSTSLEFAKFLNGNGELHLFDYEDRVENVAKGLAKAGFQNVKTFGSSYKLLDSYNWSLAQLLEKNTTPIYDYVYLDGAHNWAFDALATFLIDRLLTVGGYLDFDDYDWTYANSPTAGPNVFPLTKKLYTQLQISSQQVKMIVDLIVKRDSRYKEIVANKIFQKIASWAVKNKSLPRRIRFHRRHLHLNYSGCLSLLRHRHKAPPLPPLSPLTALITQYRRSVDPITARGKSRGAEPARPEAVAELAWLLASVHPNLFHAFIEDPHAAAIPADPDFAADQFGWRFVKGSLDFHVAVAMNAAPAFPETGKERSRQRLQMRAFLFKKGSHLFARCAMDAGVGDAAQ